LRFGAPDSGGGGHIDFWRTSLVGGDVVQLSVDEPTVSNNYTFALFRPGTTDTSFSATPALTSVETNGSANDVVNLQAPYSGVFVLGVCESPGGGDCRNAETGSAVYPMGSYTFIPTLVGGGIPASTGRHETKPSNSIQGAHSMTIGALEAGGGGHIDFWLVTLAGGDMVQFTVDEPYVENNYAFELYRPGTTDTSFPQNPAATQVGTNGSASDVVVLQAPYSGTFVLGVCESPSSADCGTVDTGAGVRPMGPYTFTTTLVSGPPPGRPAPVQPPHAASKAVSLAIPAQSIGVSASGSFAVSVSCTGAPCSGTLELTAASASTVVIVAQATFNSLPVGPGKVAMALTPSGSRLLDQDGHHLRTQALALYRSGSQTKTTEGPVTLAANPAR
jgi:hypothetical protein